MLSSINPIRDLLDELVGGQALQENEYRKVTQLRDMLDKLLLLDPSKRLNIHNAMTHPFITEKI